MKALKKIFSTALVTATIATGVVGFGTAAPAVADDCKGENSFKMVFKDFDGKVNHYDIKMDSCKVNEFKKFLSGADDVAKAGGYIADLIPYAGQAKAFLGLWALQNKSAIEDCSKKGSGITFHQAGTGIAGCEAQ